MIPSYIQLHKNCNDEFGGFSNFHIFQTQLKQCHIPPVLHRTSPAHSLLMWQHTLITLHMPHNSGLSWLRSCPGLQCQTTNSAMLLLPSICRSVSEIHPMKLAMIVSPEAAGLIPCRLLDSWHWPSAWPQPSSFSCWRRAQCAALESRNIRGFQGHMFFLLM